MKRLLWGVLVSVLWVVPARAGTEVFPIEAADLFYDGGTYWGSAYPVQGPHGTDAKAFPSYDIGPTSQWSTAIINLPSYLTVPVQLSCQVFGRVADTDITRKIQFRIGFQTSRPGSVWDDNYGYNVNVGLSQPMIVNPQFTAYGQGASTIQSAPVADQSTGGQCGSVSGVSLCANYPTRVYLKRDNVVDNSNNDANAYEVIKVVCTAPTN